MGGWAVAAGLDPFESADPTGSLPALDDPASAAWLAAAFTASSSRSIAGISPCSSLEAVSRS